MIDTQQLAARFGTPLYVYRLDRVAAASADLRRTLPPRSTLYYSVKANPHPDVVRALLSHGCQAEVSSTGELSAVSLAGGTGGRCLYTGPGKTDAELATALRAGVRLFSVESPRELARLDGAADRARVDVNCLVRVNVDRVAGAAGLRMAGRASQFGSDLSRILAEAEAFRGTRRARATGVHVYSGTNVWEPKGLLDLFEVAASAAVRLRDACRLPLRRLDLGGGFAAPYASPGERPVYDFRDQLESLLDTYLPDRGDAAPDAALEIAFESGRYLVAECGELICRVLDVKRSRDRTFAILDTGIHHLGGLSGLGRLLPVAASPVTAAAGNRPPATVDLAGPLCTPTDLLGRGVRLPEPRPGDVVAIPNVGAYGLTASLVAFLGHPAPAEVVLDGDELVSTSRLTVSRNALEEARP